MRIDTEKITDWNSVIQKEFGGAEGIYVVHCISSERCPCYNFHLCIGIYKILGWNLWMEWRKQNCIVEESPTLWTNTHFREVFPQILPHNLQ